ncbi:MAG: 50S ribosomal protein L35ae [Candidatus Woesearchaeota archaeon]|nr:50S ribosomal protein L35ae [Candidatus Woesearchaeota archaeon]
MDAVISNFRRSLKRTSGNHMVIVVPSITKRADAEKLVGKKVSWKSPGKEHKEITGVIRSAHGNSGAVRAIFESGMPGQAVGKKVQIS